MRKRTLSRREMLGGTVPLVRLVHLAAVGSMPVLLSACTKPEFRCQDVSALGEGDLELRTTLEYRDDSPHGEQKSCSNCAFYVASKENTCGLCTLVRGPIHPLGYCNSWAAKV
jgi:hypothetical protein